MALTANKGTLLRDGAQFEYDVKANAEIYGGALVELSGNAIKKAEAGTGKQYRGILQSQEKVTGGAADGDVKVTARRRGLAKFNVRAGGWDRGASSSTPSLGDTAYVDDDETVVGHNNVATSNTVDRSALGEVEVIDADGVWVWVE